MSKEHQEKLLNKLSHVVSKETNKPEQYVMVSIKPTSNILFGGNISPAAFVEFKGLSYDVALNKELTHAICEVLEKEASVAPNRTYVVFDSVSAEMWGWNNRTFAT